jgi:hypothetical protein
MMVSSPDTGQILRENFLDNYSLFETDKNLPCNRVSCSGEENYPGKREGDRGNFKRIHGFFE